jgi:hypothetical protein
MNRSRSLIRSSALVLTPLALAATLSGCTLLGLGAAAGATVGGCALLDADNDDQISRTELASGLYDNWDDDGNDMLTRAEFADGVDSRAAYSAWSGDFDSWDTDDDGMLSETEFRMALQEDENAEAFLDDQCDALGL